MAIGTPVAGTLATDATGTSTFGVAYPAGISAGDQLVLFVDASSATLPTNPAGWTSQTSGTSGGSSPSFRISTKLATGSESGSLTVTKPSVTSQGVIVRVPGVDQTTAIDVTSPTPFGSSSSVTAYNIPGVTTTMTGVCLMYLGASNSSTGSFTPPTVPAAFTELVDNASPIPRFTVGYLIWSGSGATGTVNLVATSARGAAGLIALRPANTTKTIDATLAVTATLGAADLRQTFAATSLALNVSFGASTTIALTAAASASLPVTATIGADVTRTQPADSTLAVTATIGASAAETGLVSATLPVTATIGADLVRTQFADTSLAVTATISATPDSFRPLDSTLAVTATISAGAIKGIILVGAGTWTETTLPNPSLPYPTGIQAGDVLVLLWTHNTSAVPNAQTGYTTVDRFSGTGSTTAPGVYAGVKYATGSESGSLTFTQAGSAAGSGQILAFRNVHPSNIQDVVADSLDKTSTFSGNFNFPAMSIPRVGDALVYIMMSLNATATQTPPSNPTNFVETGDRTTGRAASAGYLVWQGSGSTGTMTVTSTQTNAGVGILLSLRSLAPGATGLDSSLDVVATIGATMARTQSAGATLAVTATVGSTIAISSSQSASLAVTATISAAALRTGPLDTSLAVTATISSAAVLSRTLAASLAITVTFVVTTTTPITSTLAITATTSAAMALTARPSSTLAVTATITAAAVETLVFDSTLAIVATITTAAIRTQAGAATLAVVATITSGTALTALVGATLAVTATITTVVSVGMKASLAVTATITTDAVRLFAVVSSLAVTATIGASLAASRQLASSLAVTATIVAAAAATAFAAATLAIAATITTGAGVTRSLAATLQITAIFAAALTVTSQEFVGVIPL